MELMLQKRDWCCYGVAKLVWWKGKPCWMGSIVCRV